MTATVPDQRSAPSRRLPSRSAVPGLPRPVRERPPRVTTGADEPRLVTSAALTMLSLLSLWMLLQLTVLGGLAQARSQDLLYRDLRTQLAAATAPLGPVTPLGAPVSLLQIPALDLDQVVVEGTGSGQTLSGPGHLRNTVLPGQAGTSVVMGRAQTYGAPFGDLAALRAGDTITTTTAQGTTEFTVLGVRRAGDPLPQPLAAGSARLVLVSAERGGFASLAAGSAIYVDADATTSSPAPAGLPVAVPDAERPLQGDPGALPLLALHLTLLLAVVLAVVRARQRQPAALVWVIAAPLALAATWLSTETAMRLLPNLL